jgi:hypothetical protein
MDANGWIKFYRSKGSLKTVMPLLYYAFEPAVFGTVMDSWYLLIISCYIWKMRRPHSEVSMRSHPQKLQFSSSIFEIWNTNPTYWLMDQVAPNSLHQIFCLVCIYFWFTKSIVFDILKNFLPRISLMIIQHEHYQYTNSR